MPKINVYLPDELAAAVRDAQLPVSAICQAALERAVRDVSAARAADQPPTAGADRPDTHLYARFTPRARQAVVLAQQLAGDPPHRHVGTEHLLLGVLDEGGNLALKVLTALEVDPGDLRAELIASRRPPNGADPPTGTFTPLATKVLELTAKEALGMGHNYIGCEHLLLGLLAAEEGLASQVLRRMGLELRTTRRAVITALSGFVHARDATAPQPATLQQILDRLDAIEHRLLSHAS